MIRQLVSRAPTVLLLVLCILVFGGLSYSTLPREAAPDVKIPVVMVSTPYFGVSPADIESLVTIPVENELAGVKDLKKMSSTSAEGISIVALEFEPDIYIPDALQRVRDRVNRAKPNLPDDAEEPNVQEVSFSDFPIVLVTIAGDTEEQQLKSLAESLEEELSRISGVLDTRLSGGLTREISVNIDPRRLASMGFGLDDVSTAIRNENVNVPGGNVDAGDSTYLLRVPGEFSMASQIGNVAVKRKGDRPVFIRDLGTVADGFAERDTFARMNGRSAVTVGVTKRAGANIIDIVDEVRRITAEHQETWPTGVEHRLLADQSKQIRDMVSDLENNIMTALILVVAVVLVFMGARNSLFVAISVPLSMLMSFAVIQSLGITLNMVVLFSLILALGMLVDNAIVIVENVYRHMELGKDLRTASIDGTREVSLAVMASTATTVAAFFPLVFWTGIMGEFMGYLPKTVIIVLVSSLVVAIGILPVATARFLKRTTSTSIDIVESNNVFVRGYRTILDWSIRWRYASAVLMVVTLFGTFVIYGMFNHGVEFFPETEPQRATVAVRAPDGTQLQATDRIVRQVEAVLAKHENVEVFVAETGVSGGGNPMEGSQASPNGARITVDFWPDANSARPGQPTRVQNTFDTIDDLRAALAEIPGAEIEVAPEAMGPPVGAAIAVEITGPEFDAVGELAQQLRRAISQIEGTTDLSDDYRVGRPELRLRIDRGAAKRVGASTFKVADTVRTAVAGSKASALRDGKDEYDIIVQLDPRFRQDVQDVLALRIPGRLDTSPDTFQVPLSSVAGYQLAGGSGAIKHVDQDLVVTITGDVAPGHNANDVQAKVVELLNNWKEGGKVGPGFDVRLGGAQDEQAETQAFLGRAFLIALALIALVLVTQFNGFRLPIIILTSVFLSLVGVLWGLLLTGTSFGVIMTGLGVISLAGVVVNNAIVLLDYVEQLRDQGLETKDALMRAGLTRFRPVMLTAITTILGLVPMAVGLSFDFRKFRPIIGGQSAEWWGPMAVAVIFGLAFATVLTLVMVPTMYSIFEDFIGLWNRLLGRKPKGPNPAVAGAALLLCVAPGMADAGVLTLEQVLAHAETEAIEAQIAAAETRVAAAQRGKGWSYVMPRVTTTGAYTINQREVEFDTGSFGSFSLADSLEAGISPAYAGLFDFDAMRAQEATAAAENATDPMVITPKTNWSGNITVVQPLFSGQAYPALAATLNAMSAARLKETRARHQVRQRAAIAYYQLLLSRQRSAISEQAVASAQRQLDLVTRQADAGSVPPRARLQAQLGLRQAERAAAQARAGQTDAEQGFHVLTGLSPDAELVMPDPPTVPPNLEQALTNASGARPDVAAADIDVTVARQYKASEALGYAPVVTARFTDAYTQNVAFGSEDNWSWMVVFEASWTLFDGGLRAANLRERSARVRQAELAATLAHRQVEMEVRSAWAELVRARHSLESTQDEIALATENLRLAEAALGSGGVSYLEVEDARLALTQAQLAELSERAARDLAAIQLRVSLGQY